MASYESYLTKRFPHNESIGLYRSPNFPAVKLGRVLARDTRIAQPSDVLALYLREGTFSSDAFVFTKDQFFFDNGNFMLEDVRKAEVDHKELLVWINQKGEVLPVRLDVGNAPVAAVLQKIFEDIAYNDPASTELIEQTYEGYDPSEVNWLKIRDEVMRTIDMLYDRFNDGKLSLLEYEQKKTDLLDRL